MKTWKAGDRFQLSKRLVYDYHTRAAGSRGTIHLPTVGGYFATFDDSSDTVLVKPEWIAPEWNFVWSNRAEYGPVINLMEKLEAEVKKSPPRPEIGSFWISFHDDAIVQIVNVYTPRGAKHTYVQWREVSKSRSLPATFTVQSTRHSARMREFRKMFTPTLQYTGYTVLEPIVPGHVWKSKDGTEINIVSMEKSMVKYGYLKERFTRTITDEKSFRSIFEFARVPKKDNPQLKAYKEWLETPLASQVVKSVSPDIINVLVDLCHGASVDRGWYKDPVTGEPLKRNVGELIALIHSELSEALEGFRKNLMDSHLPDRKSVEIELADALIRIFDLAGYLRKIGAQGETQVNLGIGFAGKLEYNKVRADHSPEARAKADGKKF